MGSVNCCPDSKKRKVVPKNVNNPVQTVSGVWIFTDKDGNVSNGVKQNIELEYTIGSQLGQPGQFGVAYNCTRIKDNVEFAVKKIEKRRFSDESNDITSEDRAIYYQQFRDEITLMQAMEHPNIIKLYDVFEDAESLNLVMEKCKGGELFDRMKDKQRYSEKDAAAVLRQFAEAIQALHKKHIAHCDLKPDNILFLTDEEDSVLKLIDFGLAKHSPPGSKICGFRGTPYYVAPEIVNLDKYTYHCDMWSFGVISFVMLFGFPPFHSRNDDDEEIYNKIKEGFTPETLDGFGAWFPRKIKISEDAKDLIAKCLDADPVRRYTAEEVLDHPWLTGESASGEPLVAQVLKGLNEFTSGCKLKVAVLDVMTDILSEHEISSLQATFRLIDKNGDGHITAEELKAAMEQNFEGGKQGKLSESQLREMKCFETLIARGDVDGDGKLSYKELLATAVQRKMRLKEERMVHAFEQFDKDGNGQITITELKDMMAANGTKITDEYARNIISEVDTNNDGVVSKSEFLAMWGKEKSCYMDGILKKR